MSTAAQEIKEIDVVAFTEAVEGWPAGTEGTVVGDFGEDKLVEISDDDNFGATLALPVVSVKKLKLVAKYSE
jgi:hypothetical protein